MRANTDQAKRPPSRESFYALYWDHARDLPRFSACMLAHFEGDEVSHITSMEWDHLPENDRVRLRAAILQLLEVHDLNRKERISPPASVTAGAGETCHTDGK
jgi:hypothetical protein